jgi:AcrR family transcriptional regulator
MLRHAPNAASAFAAAGADPADRGSEEGARRRQLLDAALGVFLKFGFRKTSMDQVARAASVSRQGLYLHFSRKEELFRAVVQHALEEAFQAAGQRLADGSLSVRDRLTGAFDEWVGRHVGMLGSGASDLGEAAHALVAPLVRDYGDRFVELLAKFMRSSGLLAAYKPAGLTARQLAATLCATARGFKTESATRADFNAAVGKAVRAFCLPLAGRA